MIADNVPLLVEGKDATFQNKVHLAMEPRASMMTMTTTSRPARSDNVKKRPNHGI